MKNALLFFISIIYSLNINAQTVKSDLSSEDIIFIQNTFKLISDSDQLYRPKLQAGTLNPKILSKLNQLYKEGDAQKVFAYMSEYEKDITDQEKDSLNGLQRNLDFRNHMVIRGIWDRFGWIPENKVPEYNFVQHLLLLHPPHSLDQIQEYLDNYSTKLLPEVKAGRMPAKNYASFVDNIYGKILRQPQIYGTNGQYDPKTQTVLPPEIRNLEYANTEREKIGLEKLKEGEYRLPQN